jgi:diguanylate cyclase (GGDEF)-like protein/PAS domain S-box-containing protein
MALYWYKEITLPAAGFNPMADSAPITRVDPDVYKTLLESTKAIPWKIDWSDMRFAYIGPQIETLLGWTPDSWLTAQDWADRIHPEDRERVVSFCIAQSQAGVDHEADYRALTRDGGYVWIRDVVHVVRDANQTVEALVGFMFDISERKRTEEQLLGLQAELQDLSFKDALTGLANRRRFDHVMEREWTEAKSHRQPLSLVMIDIDYFKQYNDRYGHLQGDACLKQVADLLFGASQGARSFLSRFGGEEFALVLPDTSAEVARKIAWRCRDAIARARIPHAASVIGENLTISLGAGTTVPQDDEEAMPFIEVVDRRLYQAKQQGRDRIVAEG